MRVLRKCCVCGKEYKVCDSVKPNGKTFNWREVACSPACGKKYFNTMLRSRGIDTGAAANKDSQITEDKRANAG